MKKNFSTILATLFILGCATQKHNGTTDVTEINQNPYKYENQIVRVKGEAVEKKGENSFIFDGAGFWGDDIVVLTKKPLSEMPQLKFDEGQKIEIVGEVANVDVIDIQRRYGLDLEPELVLEFEKVKTYLIADEVVIK